MTVRTRTPDDLELTPRDRAFGRDTVNPRWWLDNDPIATACFNAFSATFPHGERFFIDSVKQFRDQAPEPLKTQIAAFIKQEAMHSREHVVFNRQASDQGYDITRCEERTKVRMDIARTRHPVAQIAATAALEHYTAIMAHGLLAEPKHLRGAPPAARDLWRWHSIEEIEHKGVAFDVFLMATQKLSGWKRWMLRCHVMLVSTWFLVKSMSANIADLLRQDGIDPKGARGRVLGYLFWKPGLLKDLIGHYLDWFRPGFHPWSVDDRGLIKDAEASLAPA